MRNITPLLILILAAPVLADEPKVHKGLPYAEPKNERQMLDVYAPTQGKNLPVVVWIHGGGWRAGDRSSVQKKPQAFVDKGYVFVATNHRFFPNVTVKEMTGDIAKAIRWVHDHAKEYGGDPKSIFVMGHSSGAHLAALVCTDDRYLKAEGLPLSIIKGCVPVDVSVYDIPKRLKDGGAVATATFSKTFGEKEESQRDYSPVTHVAKGKSIPPFLILHVADRPETKSQSNWFADKLKDAGISAKVVAAEGTNHGTINANLGKSGDRPTQEMWEFLGTALKKEPSKEEMQAANEIKANIEKTYIVLYNLRGPGLQFVTDKKAEVPSPAVTKLLVISPKEAASIIDHLAEQGMFAKASQPMEGFHPGGWYLQAGPSKKLGRCVWKLVEPQDSIVNDSLIRHMLNTLDGDNKTALQEWLITGAPKTGKAKAGPVVDGLQLSLTADTTEITFKDGKTEKPVALKLTFTNVSDKAIKFNAFDFHFSRIMGEVKAMPADSVKIQRIAPGRLPVIPKAGDFPEIKPGQSWSYDKQLGFPGSLPEGVSMFAIYSVTSPGEFRIRFTYNSPKGNDSPLAKGIWIGELISNEIVITVKK